MTDHLRVVIPGTASGLRTAAEELDRFSSAHALEMAAVWPFQVALDEILSNIVHHGLRGAGAERRIEIEIELLPADLRVTVLDDAPAFNPLEAPAPDTSLPLGKRPLGGLGIEVVRKLMDVVEYERREGRNRLVLERRIGQGPSEGGPGQSGG